MSLEAGNKLSDFCGIGTVRSGVGTYGSFEVHEIQFPNSYTDDHDLFKTRNVRKRNESMQATKRRKKLGTDK